MVTVEELDELDEADPVEAWTPDRAAKREPTAITLEDILQIQLERGKKTRHVLTTVTKSFKRREAFC